MRKAMPDHRSLWSGTSSLLLVMGVLATAIGLVAVAISPVPPARGVNAEAAGIAHVAIAFAATPPVPFRVPAFVAPPTSLALPAGRTGASRHDWGTQDRLRQSALMVEALPGTLRSPMGNSLWNRIRTSMLLDQRAYLLGTAIQVHLGLSTVASGEFAGLDGEAVSSRRSRPGLLR